MAGIFKAYDIRGIYGDTLNEDIAKKIGRAFVTFLKCKKVVIGMDMRPHSEPLFKALAEGITMQGADVINIGLCSTPMCYYGTGSLKADGGIMITASHNPGEWNGFKMTREEAIPISGDTGIKDIEKIVASGDYAKSTRLGTIVTKNVMPEYIKHVQAISRVTRPLRVAVDMANAMGVYEAKAFKGIFEVDAMYEELDGTFPNHEANPLMLETLESISHKIKNGKYDFGVAFDGDADRAGFLDEKGDVVTMDVITALIAQDLLSKEKGVVFYDLRSSWAVKETIESNGGTPMMSRVGHAFIKQQMRDNKAIFAGELSGHYYFRGNFYTESSSMAAICIANILSKTGKKLSELTKPIKRYFASGEINSKVKDASSVISKIKSKYTGGRMFELDGISVEYSDWWFNVRCSNTEPLIRLNLEAKTKEVMENKRDEIISMIRS